MPVEVVLPNPIVNGKEFVQILATCSICEEETAILAPAAGYKAWQEGELIQNALPTLSEGERELLVSQTCCPCFHSLFEDDDDGFDDDDEVAF